MTGEEHFDRRNVTKSESPRCFVDMEGKKESTPQVTYRLNADLLTKKRKDVPNFFWGKLAFADGRVSGNIVPILNTMETPCCFT
jgi:hypothetical protein